MTVADLAIGDEITGASPILQMRAELDAAGARIEELEALLGLKLSVPSELGLSAQCVEILGMLLAAPGVVTLASLESALFGGRPDADWPMLPRRVIYVQMTRLRRVLGQHKISIATTTAADGSRGYFMSHDNKSKTNALISSPILNDEANAEQPSRDCAARGAQPSRGGGASQPLGQAS